jgi:hypothetical protein
MDRNYVIRGIYIMKSYLLLILAIVLLPVFFIIGYTYHLIKEISNRHDFDMSDYTDNVSYQIDVLGCALVYNVRNHTLSAMCVEREHWWFEYLINLLFWDRYHCKDQHFLEFSTKEKSV